MNLFDFFYFLAPVLDYSLAHGFDQLFFGGVEVLVGGCNKIPKLLIRNNMLHALYLNTLYVADVFNHLLLFEAGFRLEHVLG